MSRALNAALDAVQDYHLWNFVHPDAKKRSDASGLDADYFGPSLTNQSDAPAADINNIMQKYVQTGLIDHLNQYQGRYGDFLDATTYHEALNHVIAADDMFNSLPAQIRAKFENDPAKFLEFAQNADNETALRELGLTADAVPPVSSAEGAPTQAGAPAPEQAPVGA